jgi:hypothetical protein
LNLKELAKYLLFVGIIFFAQTAFSTGLYFLCASDEDGCDENTYQYCACIPYNETHAETPHCLDFDSLTCMPQALSSSCDPAFVYRNQGDCLASMYQSVLVPPCQTVTYDFCIKHHSQICDVSGRPSTCKR